GAPCPLASCAPLLNLQANAFTPTTHALGHSANAFGRSASALTIPTLRCKNASSAERPHVSRRVSGIPVFDRDRSGARPPRGAARDIRAPAGALRLRDACRSSAQSEFYGTRAARPRRHFRDHLRPARAAHPLAPG